MLPLLTEDEAAAARRYLTLFSAEAQRLGKQILAFHQIESPAWDMFESGYRARVGHFSVAAAYANGKWSLRCYCANRPKCEHTYALLERLLKQYSPTPTPREDAASGEDNGSEDLNDFGRTAIEKVLGRRLNGSERTYVNAVQALWRTLQTNGEIRTWELEKIGYNPWYRPNTVGRFWAQPPQNPYTFWLHIAHAIRQQGGQIHQFLEPSAIFR